MGQIPSLVQVLLAWSFWYCAYISEKRRKDLGTWSLFFFLTRLSLADFRWQACQLLYYLLTFLPLKLSTAPIILQEGCCRVQELSLDQACRLAITLSAASQFSIQRLSHHKYCLSVFWTYELLSVATSQRSSLHCIKTHLFHIQIVKYILSCRVIYHLCFRLASLVRSSLNQQLTTLNDFSALHWLLWL
jgi:hypothetical protein